MGIKMISFDLDGTLINDGKISKKTVEAFKILKKKGIKLIANTGRSIQSLKPIFEKLDLLSNEDMCILTTGSSICENLSGKILYHKHLTLKDYFYLKKELYGKYNMSVYTPHEIFYVDNIFQEIIVDNETLKMPIYLFDEKKELEISRINIMDDKEKLDDFMENYDKSFLKDYYYVRNIDFSVEILNKDASKGNGLIKLMKMFHILPDEVLAIGDGNNDISMFKVVKYSVAMGNAKENVKKEAKYVTDSILEDGFYNICKKMGLLD